MPLYTYKAKTTEGAERKGELTANSEPDAVTILQSQGLVVTNIEEIQERKRGKAFKLPFLPPVSSKDLVVFTRQLSTLVDASVPIVQAFESLAQQQKNKFFKERLEWLAGDISGGMPLSQALRKYPRIFNKFFVAMVQVGESTGNIAQTFTYLADYMEKDYETKRKIWGALTYPIVVIVAFIIIAVIMMIFVLPQLTAMFQEVDRALPFLTTVIVAIGEFSQEYWYVLILGVLVIPALFAILLLYTKPGKRIWDKYSLKIPVMGGLLKKIFLARFAESMATLIDGGMPMLETIQVTESVMTNSMYKGILQNLLLEVQAGRPMSDTLAKAPDLFPAMVTQLIKVGESTGKTADTLKTSARFYQMEVDNVVENLTSLIEPILLVFLGLVVGALVVGILMPIYDFSAQGL